jgi:hypothetical protein
MLIAKMIDNKMVYPQLWILTWLLIDDESLKTSHKMTNWMVARLCKFNVTLERFWISKGLLTQWTTETFFCFMNSDVLVEAWWIIKRLFTCSIQVRCTCLVCIPYCRKQITYYLANTERKQIMQFLSNKCMFKKGKRMSIIAAWDHYSTVAIFLNLLVFHCTQPLRLNYG